MTPPILPTLRPATRISLAALGLGLAATLAAAPAIEVRPAPLREIPSERPQTAPELVWIQGQDAIRSTAHRHGWYDSVRKSELAGGDWLSHFSSEPAEAVYEVPVPSSGTYHFWLRANPSGGARMEFRIDGGPWTAVDFSRPVQQVNIAADGQPDLRHVAWLDLGTIDLRQGRRTVRFRLTSPNNNHGGIDAFVFARDRFEPNYALRPGESSGLADPGKWAFEPPPDPLSEHALLDLRYLNHIPAGRHGFIGLSADGQSFVDGRGRPIRFWSGTTYVASGQTSVEDITRHGHFYAKRGINMVRYHGNLAPRGGNDFGRVNEQALDEIWRLVAGMKAAGIYTTLSPYWATPTPYRPEWGLPNPDHDNLNGLLFFDPKTQAGYRAWLRALFTRPNPYTGIPLKDEPAFAVFQIQNEDSLLFWTAQRIQGEAGALLRRQFADWLREKYGSLEAARRAWNGHTHEQDDFARGEAGLHMVWHLTQNATGGLQQRLSDQLEFTARTMHAFNAGIHRFIREELGAPQLINAGNWKTADDLRLLDAERWSYTANEVLGVNKYFGVTHVGERAGHAILRGDHYQARSALRHPRSLPTNIKHVIGHPMLVPESQWVPPNPYQTEGPLAVAAYSSLTGLDSFYWFTIGRGHEAPFGKWQTSTPAQQGMFPAAALIFRQGYLREGEPVVHEERRLEDIWQRRSSVLVEDPGFDPNRDAGDLPTELERTAGVDPLAFLVGPVRVRYDGDPARTRIADLDTFIDADEGVVRSNTGEIELDHRRGILRVDAPKAQAAAGFLGAAGTIRLSDVILRTENDYLALYVVSLDGEDLRTSRHVLVQAGTVARPYGYREEPATFTAGDREVRGHRITDLGSAPWNLDKNRAEISLRNEHLDRAVALDGNGDFLHEIPVRRHGTSLSFTFPEDALYVILR
ncbi:MAG: hypothetical protein EA425_08145 [Puniceicoccaceae bacterium]|nr:MAG: hypothetical protein EA425_08145 [Puniceicoccaceae bacterium]